MAAMDLVRHVLLDPQLVMSLGSQSPLGSSDGCVPVQLCAGMRQQEFGLEERGGVEEQCETRGGGEEAGVGRSMRSTSLRRRREYRRLDWMDGVVCRV